MRRADPVAGGLEGQTGGVAVVTIRRGLALLLLFASAALGRVDLRTEEARLAARIEALRAERVELRREAWALQMEAARLSTPTQIRERADRWRLEVRAPWSEFVDLNASRLAGR